jgi:branched-chain amino acid transport system ATP-binding protein
VLLLSDLRAGYGGAPVLHGVTLAVPPGSVVALLGPNGAGKTTLLRVASGLLRTTSGRMVLDGNDVTRRPSHELAALGVCHVPEGRGVFPTMTVRDNVLLQAKPGQEREALDRAVTAFPRLGQRMRQLAGTMSGGEQQMLALARAYVQRPRVVLLDEVSMGLAPKVVDEIFEFLKALAAEGTSLLLVEQYVTRALEASDYLYLLDRGTVSFAGEPGELDSAAIFASYLGAGGQ